MRKFVLLAHILSSVSWIGVDLVMGVLSFRGLTTDDPQTLATAYGGLALFCVPLLLTLGLLTLTTGVVLGLGTRFGLARYWWVVTKLVITVVLCVLVLVLLRPTLAEAGTQTALVDGTLPGRLDRRAAGHDLPAHRVHLGAAVRELALGLQAVGCHSPRASVPPGARARAGKGVHQRVRGHLGFGHVPDHPAPDPGRLRPVDGAHPRGVRRPPAGRDAALAPTTSRAPATTRSAPSTATSWWRGW